MADLVSINNLNKQKRKMCNQTARQVIDKLRVFVPGTAGDRQYFRNKLNDLISLYGNKDNELSKYCSDEERLSYQSELSILLEKQPVSRENFVERLPGAPCETDSDCSGNEYCDPSDNTCKVRNEGTQELTSRTINIFDSIENLINDGLDSIKKFESEIKAAKISFTLSFVLIMLSLVKLVTNWDNMRNNTLKYLVLLLSLGGFAMPILSVVSLVLVLFFIKNEAPLKYDFDYINAF